MTTESEQKRIKENKQWATGSALAAGALLGVLTSLLLSSLIPPFLGVLIVTDLLFLFLCLHIAYRESTLPAWRYLRPRFFLWIFLGISLFILPALLFWIAPSVFILSPLVASIILGTVGLLFNGITLYFFLIWNYRHTEVLEDAPYKALLLKSIPIFLLGGGITLSCFLLFGKSVSFWTSPLFSTLFIGGGMLIVLILAYKMASKIGRPPSSTNWDEEESPKTPRFAQAKLRTSHGLGVIFVSSLTLVFFLNTTPMVPLIAVSTLFFIGLGTLGAVLYKEKGRPETKPSRMTLIGTILFGMGLFFSAPGFPHIGTLIFQGTVTLPPASELFRFFLALITGITGVILAATGYTLALQRRKRMFEAMKERTRVYNALVERVTDVTTTLNNIHSRPFDSLIGIIKVFLDQTSLKAVDQKEAVAREILLEGETLPYSIKQLSFTEICHTLSTVVAAIEGNAALFQTVGKVDTEELAPLTKELDSLTDQPEPFSIQLFALFKMLQSKNGVDTEEKKEEEKEREEIEKETERASQNQPKTASPQTEPLRSVSASSQKQDEMLGLGSLICLSLLYSFIHALFPPALGMMLSLLLFPPFLVWQILYHRRPPKQVAHSMNRVGLWVILGSGFVGLSFLAAWQFLPLKFALLAPCFALIIEHILFLLFLFRTAEHAQIETSVHQKTALGFVLLASALGILFLSWTYLFGPGWLLDILRFAFLPLFLTGGLGILYLAGSFGQFTRKEFVKKFRREAVLYALPLSLFVIEFIFLMVPGIREWGVIAPLILTIFIWGWMQYQSRAKDDGGYLSKWINPTWNSVFILFLLAFAFNLGGFFISSSSIYLVLGIPCALIGIWILGTGWVYKAARQNPETQPTAWMLRGNLLGGAAFAWAMVYPLVPKLWGPFAHYAGFSPSLLGPTLFVEILTVGCLLGSLICVGVGYHQAKIDRIASRMTRQEDPLISPSGGPHRQKSSTSLPSGSSHRMFTPSRTEADASQTERSEKPGDETQNLISITTEAPTIRRTLSV